MNIGFHCIVSFIVPFSNEAQSYPFSENPPNLYQVFLNELLKISDFRIEIQKYYLILRIVRFF
jgi:hypothetical protein